MFDVISPTLCHLFTLEARLAAPLDAGDGPLGRRTLNAVSQGRFSGSRLSGHIHPGTGDWMLARADIRIIDARITLITEDGALIHMRYGGRLRFDRDALAELADPSTRHLVDPSRYYFRTVPEFETGHPAYRWLNGLVSVGVGRLIEGGVAYEVFEVL